MMKHAAHAPVTFLEIPISIAFSRGEKEHIKNKSL